jgi:hypothetical protein
VEPSTQVRAAWDSGLGGLEHIVPPCYTHSSLAVIDAIFSIRAHYTSARKAVTRYAARFDVPDIGLDVELEDEWDIASLAGNLAALSDEELTDLFGSSQQTGGRLKATAVRDAADSLVKARLTDRPSVSALALDDRRGRDAWASVVGLGDATWRYVRILLGCEDVKPDRMILGWLENALGNRPSEAEAVDLVADLASTLGMQRRIVEHSIWRYQSGRT